MRTKKKNPKIIHDFELPFSSTECEFRRPYAMCANKRNRNSGIEKSCRADWCPKVKA